MFTQYIYIYISFSLFIPTNISSRHAPIRRDCQDDECMRLTVKARRERAEWVYPDHQRHFSSVRWRSRRCWPRMVAFFCLPVFEYSSILVLNYMQARLLPAPCPSVARHTQVRDRFHICLAANLISRSSSFLFVNHPMPACFITK